MASECVLILIATVAVINSLVLRLRCRHFICHEDYPHHQSNHHADCEATACPQPITEAHAEDGKDTKQPGSEHPKYQLSDCAISRLRQLVHALEAVGSLCTPYRITYCEYFFLYCLPILHIRLDVVSTTAAARIVQQSPKAFEMLTLLFELLWL